MTAGLLWILHETLVVDVKPPLIGWVSSRTHVTSVVQWAPTDASWTVQICTMESEPILGAVTRWPAAHQSAPRTRPVAFDGARFVSGPTVESVGDSDGITIEVAHNRIGRGQVVVRQTAELGWDGILGEDGVVRGTMTYVPTQEQLAANRWWLRRPLRLRSAPGSTFELVPAAAGTTCGDLP